MAKNKTRKKKKIIVENLVCPFKGSKQIDYKDVYRLKRFITTRGRILSSSRTGVCSKHQRDLAKAIKRARYMGLLPYCNYS